jgi:hypothetical protein
MILIGIDDTDTLDSRGTGHLARDIATTLSGDYDLLGVTRHQLLFDPRIPCTKKNSCAAVLLDAPDGFDLDDLYARVRGLMLADFVVGSDPGLCIAAGVSEGVTAFGRRAQQSLVTQSEARAVASAYEVRLAGLGGDEDGVIGALAAVGLAACGEDGRYVLVGRVRELQGPQPPSALLDAGIAAVQTLDGAPVTTGLVMTERLRPARRGGRPIAIVERATGPGEAKELWMPLKLD